LLEEWSGQEGGVGGEEIEGWEGEGAGFDYDDLGVSLFLLESLRSAGSDSGVIMYFQEMH